MKWPYDDCEPPDRIYIGRDIENGEVIVTWFIWPTMSDDICYIRKDLVDKKIKEIMERKDGLASQAPDS